jgi:transposase
MTMRTAQAHSDVYPAAKLYVAIELASEKWKLAMGDGPARKPRIVTAEPFDAEKLKEALRRGAERFGLPADVEVLVVMEAGRDGFSVHRWLEHLGIGSIVIDAASVEVNRHKRRAKTDRVDAERLLERLMQYDSGSRFVWRVCRVPSEEAEDARRLHRERETLVAERTEHLNRMKGLMVVHGIVLRVGPNFLEELSEVRDPRGRPLPKRARAELEREHSRLLLVREQIHLLEGEMKALVKARPAPGAPANALKAWMAAQLRGIGPIAALTVVGELFGWRNFENRRQVGSAAGLTPTPYDTGKTEREQGISKTGSRRVRRIMVEAAWSWLRYQPDSALSQWFTERYSVRGKKKGIVALARKLLVALWHWVDHGTAPAGASFKSNSPLLAA